jgi:hypothetical protein
MKNAPFCGAFFISATMLPDTEGSTDLDRHEDPRIAALNQQREPVA